MVHYQKAVVRAWLAAENDLLKLNCVQVLLHLGQSSQYLNFRNSPSCHLRALVNVGYQLYRDGIAGFPVSTSLDLAIGSRA